MQIVFQDLAVKLQTRSKQIRDSKIFIAFLGGKSNRYYNIIVKFSNVCPLEEVVTNLALFLPDECCTRTAPSNPIKSTEFMVITFYKASIGNITVKVNCTVV